MPIALQTALGTGIVLIGAAIFGAIFLVADSLHDRLSGRRRAPAQERVPAPPPPRVSPFAPPPSAAASSTPAAGEVKP